ncbi:uncharacterized protein EV420DRAFT_1636753 [Desarmillaria tabescens]|uniref:DUF6534 domain-containing protein n=1 Tax=Armillaria tabescens TaxID=1929756 RepID=A0AA39U392_ARMTA|nr:uncharacterized protein EV420DRAFT_1636753 [Desarmillaria tabescens]KAK0466155.1 hypothetical protein EV420DRAFT_1636753 [Desarmillaria tabescens]
MNHPLGIYIEYISVVITAALWGLTCVQTFQYFVYHHRRDHPSLKLLVIFLWIVDTLHTAFLSHGFWRVIDNNVSPVTIEVWYLVYINSYGSSLPPLRSSFSRGEFGDSALNPVGDPLSCYSFRLLSIPFLQQSPLVIVCQDPGSTMSSVTKLLESVWAISAAVDILISASLLSILWIGRKDALRSTTQILHRLSILIVNTGLWTSLVTLLTLLGLVIWEEQDIYAALSFITCPLYCNTLLANLNTRDYIRQGIFPSNKGAGTTSVLQLDTHTTSRCESIPLNDQFASRKFGNASDGLV